MVSWVIGGRTVTAEDVEFSDIQPGDEIIHLFVPDDDSGDVKIWGGVVQEFAPNSREWYGSSRFFSQANDFFGDGFSEPQVASTGEVNDVLVVAEWHAFEERHSIYRVV